MNGYIVTGGAGFIGSHLASRLIRDGHEVVVVDDLSLGRVENIPKGTTFIKSTCSRLSKITVRTDGIFHLGIPSSSPMYRDNPGLAGRAIEEFEHVLRFCMREGCRLVYASTSSVYNGNPVPWHEDMPIHPTDLYTEARYCMERLARVYHDLYGVESVGLRLFSVYGPGEEHKGRYANMVSQILWAIKKGERPVIYGDGSQGRDFVYVDDVVEAFIKAMECNVKCDIFNVGTGKMATFKEVVSIVNEALGTSVEPIFVENPIKNYVYRTLADTRKAEKFLGFKSATLLEEGVRRCV